MKSSAIYETFLFLVLVFHTVEAFSSVGQTLGNKCSCTSSSRSSLKRKSYTKFMAFGLEKLNSQIETENPRVEPSIEKSLFGRRAGNPSQQNGNDERFRDFHSKTAQSLRDELNDALFEIDMNMKKKKLLDGLCGEWSEAEKLDRIQIAEQLDGTLQSTNTKNNIQMACMDPQGEVQRDWDFTI